MNIVDLIVFVIVIIFVLIFYRLGLLAVLKSFIGFLIAAIISTLILGAILTYLSNLGWRENVFTPLALYPLIIVILWGIAMTILNQIIPNRTGLSLSIASIPISIIYGFSVCTVLYLFVPQLIAPRAITLANDSAFAKAVDNISVIKSYQNRFLGPISSDMAESVILSSETNEAIMLNIDPKKISSSPALADSLFNLINNNRQSVSLDLFKRDPLLDQAAYNYALEILQTKKFSHLDLMGADLKTRAKTLGVQFDYLGENLAIAPTMEAAHYGLVNSESHRANIQSPVFRKIGIAVLDIDNSNKLIVEEFSN